jgi:hypothetical protein
MENSVSVTTVLDMLVFRAVLETGERLVSAVSKIFSVICLDSVMSLVEVALARVELLHNAAPISVTTSR